VVWQVEPTFITDCECHHFRNGWNGRSTFGCVTGAVLAGMREQRPWSKQAAPPVLSTGTSPSLHKICPFPFFIFLSPFNLPSPDDSRRPAMTLFHKSSYSSKWTRSLAGTGRKTIVGHSVPRCLPVCLSLTSCSPTSPRSRERKNRV